MSHSPLQTEANGDDVGYTRAAAGEIVPWLQRTYELLPVSGKAGDSLPSLLRRDVYDDYVRYCETTNKKPIAASNLGRLVRQAFPTIDAKRLGARGQSKYCYIGLRRRAGNSQPSSPPEYPPAKVSPTTHTSSTLYRPPLEDDRPVKRTRTAEPPAPEAPPPKFKIEVPKLGGANGHEECTKHRPSGVGTELASAFYQFMVQHDQRMVRYFSELNLSEIVSQLRYFWEGLPPRFAAILLREDVLHFMILHLQQLIPLISEQYIKDPLDEVPLTALYELRKFICGLESNLKVASRSTPVLLRTVSMHLINTAFVGSLLPKVSIAILAQQLRQFLSSRGAAASLFREWSKVDVPSLRRQWQALMHERLPLVDEIFDSVVAGFGRLVDAACGPEAVAYGDTGDDRTPPLVRVFGPRPLADWVHAILASFNPGLPGDADPTTALALAWQPLCSLVQQELMVVAAQPPVSVAGHHTLNTCWTFVARYFTWLEARQRMPASPPPPPLSPQVTCMSEVPGDLLPVAEATTGVLPGYQMAPEETRTVEGIYQYAAGASPSYAYPATASSPSPNMDWTPSPSSTVGGPVATGYATVAMATAPLPSAESATAYADGGEAGLPSVLEPLDAEELEGLLAALDSPRLQSFHALTSADAELDRALALLSSDEGMTL